MSCCGPAEEARSGTTHRVQPVAGPRGQGPAGPGSDTDPDAAAARGAHLVALARRRGVGTQPRWRTVPAGAFVMGSDRGEGYHEDGEGPARRVDVSAVELSWSPLTVAQFAAFVAATGYVTVAERAGWSYVFAGHVDEGAAVLPGLVAGAPWWRPVAGATWWAPGGIRPAVDRLDHPVVHLAWADAVAVAGWYDARLPTEAEWEKAARGGLEQARYPWGEELTPGGVHQANIWQGSFPERDEAEDGYAGTSPVGQYPPNGHGLVDVAGNVWEWCADWFSPRWHVTARPATRIDPVGPSSGRDRVVRGGSHLCHASYCHRYRVAARSHEEPGSTTSHLGVRLARRPEAPGGATVGGGG